MLYNQDYWSDVARVVPNIPNIEKLYGRRILVTGATGLICSAVIDVIVWLNNYKNASIHLKLAGRDKKRITERFGRILTENDFEFVEFDATKPQTIHTTIDHIIHGAGNANPVLYSTEPVETLIGNVFGVQSVLEVARENSGSRILYISSSEVYGNKIGKSNQPFREDEYGYVDILRPRACYPNGKRAAETLCMCYGKEFGTDSVIVRPGHIYGPSITKNDTRASAAFTRDIAEGRSIVMKSPGTQLRSYCYSLDCASAILTVLLNGKNGEAYNISNKDSIVSIREMADAFAIASGSMVTFDNPTDAEQKSYNMMDNSALNSEKIESLGWKAVFSMIEGAERTIRFYKEV